MNGPHDHNGKLYNLVGNEKCLIKIIGGILSFNSLAPSGLFVDQNKYPIVIRPESTNRLLFVYTLKAVYFR